jgi:hypothetical protein
MRLLYRRSRHAVTIGAALLLALAGPALLAHTARAATSDDLVIVTNTPDVTHAPEQSDVTFTITAQNSGTVAEQPAIDLARGIGDLILVSQTCPGASSVLGTANSGWTCYYPPLAPGATLTATLTAQIINTPDRAAFEVACVAPADQISGSFNFPPGGCQTANVTIDPNLSGTGVMYADLAVDSITPSVTHAKPGDLVTFTVVASNHGRDAGSMYVIGPAVTDGLSFNPPPGVFFDTLCGAFNGPAPTPDANQGPSADGGACEYDLVPPGTAVIDIFPAIVQSPGVVTDTACADGLASPTQISPLYACNTAAVEVDDGSPTPTTAPAPVSAPAPTSPPSPITGPVTGPAALPSTSGTMPVTNACPGYMGRRDWRYTILIHHKVSCRQSRSLIHRADRVVRRTGMTVKVSSWACRREPVLQHGHAWLDTCGQRRGALVIWTERRGR